MPATPDKPPTIWEAHPTFWNNRRFVAWQLLRRNRKYRKAIDYYKTHSSHTPDILIAKFSFPPWAKKVRFQQWWLMFGVEPGQSAILPRTLTEEETIEIDVGRMMYHAPLSPPPSIPSSKGLSRSGFKPVKALVADIRAKSPWKSQYMSRFPLVDYDVDFPAPFFLPIFIQKPPSEKNRKAYGLYLYDRKFEPFDVGDGRPRNIKEALKVWDLSDKGKMKDADIARTLYGLKYRHPDKPVTLQRVHDLKKSADTAIRSIYP